MKKLDIIYEDKELLVVNKPSKLLTVGTEKNKEHTLYHEVREYIRKKNQKVFIVHRLDKDTSGIVLFAKTERMKNELQKNWDCFTREYIALVEGHMDKPKDTITCYLRETKSLQVFVTPDKNLGKKAITSYEVISTNKSSSMLKINIKTGRKNQIRATMSYLGHPIIGDKKYEAKSNGIGRLALHHYHLVIVHPFKNIKMEFNCKVPKQFYLGYDEVKF